MNSPAALGGTSVGGVARLGGTNRYDTARAVALASYPAGGRTDVVLASGENFPDGLSGAGLAGKVDTAVLLTAPASLSPESASALTSLFAGSGTRRVHVLGGTSAVSQAVRDTLAALGYTVIGDYSGTTRYDTSAKIAAALGVGTIGGIGGKRTAIIATGSNFADALSAGSASFAGKFPILLTDGTALSTETGNALTTLGITRVIIMGGTSAVSQAVEDAIKAKVPGIQVDRMAGATRADTAVKLAEFVDLNLFGLGYNKTRVVLFNGEGFADGLGAGPHAGKIGANLLPVSPGAVSTETAAFLAANKAAIQVVQAIGGTVAISDATLASAVTSASTTAPTATITANAGSTTVLVTFSENVNLPGVVPFGAAGDAITAGTLSGLFRINNSDAVFAANGTYTAGSKTLAIPVTALVPGDVVSIRAGADGLSGIATADGRKVTPASVTVAVDVTRPTVQVTYAAHNSKALVVKFSEAVTQVVNAGSVAALFPIATGSSGTGTGAMGGAITVTAGCGTIAALTCVIQWAGGTTLQAGNTITTGAGAFTDLATPANASLATSATVTNDAVNPSLLSATTVIAKTGTDSLTSSDGVAPASAVSVFAKATGFTGITVSYVANTGNLSPVVTVTGTAIEVKLGPAGTNAGPALAAAITASPTASALVTASGSGTSDKLAAAAAPLAGGTTTSVTTVTFSEPLQAYTNNAITVDLDGNLATVADQYDLAAAAAANASGVVVDTKTNAQAVIPGVSKVLVPASVGVDAVLDLVGLAVAAGSTVTVV